MFLNRPRNGPRDRSRPNIAAPVWSPVLGRLGPRARDGVAGRRESLMLALKAAVVGPWTTHSASQNCPDPPGSGVNAAAAPSCPGRWRCPQGARPVDPGRRLGAGSPRRMSLPRGSTLASWNCIMRSRADPAPHHPAADLDKRALSPPMRGRRTFRSHGGLRAEAPEELCGNPEKRAGHVVTGVRGCRTVLRVGVKNE